MMANSSDADKMIECPACGYSVKDYPLNAADLGPEMFTNLQEMNKKGRGGVYELDFFDTLGADEGNVFCPRCSEEFPVEVPES